MIRSMNTAKKSQMYDIIDKLYKKDDGDIIKIINKDYKRGISDEQLVEWLRCRSNPIYFILNYCHIRTVGLTLMRYTDELFHPKFRRCVRVLYRYHRCILLATRQLGKSSIAACMIAWGTNFFPNNPAIILNMRKDAAQENLKKIKHVIENLPPWMKMRAVSDSDIKTYYELANLSRITTYYPSSTHPPDTLARSLTAPILYIDEAAFIPHIDEIYGSAQPTLSSAREHAEKIGHPWFILMTSTPNGAEGDGKFFHDMYMNAVDSDILFDENEDLVENHQQIVSDVSSNGFVRVRYHWSECPDKDIEWYREQCRELNFDKRKINQELDLLFVGSSQCIFSDEVLQQLKPKKAVQTISLPHGAVMRVFSMPSPLTRDYYLIGVDTAKSISGSYSAVQIYSFKNFNQIAECSIKIDILKRISEVVHAIVMWLWKDLGVNRILLCIENNSYGSAIIENLLYHTDEIDYGSLIYMNKSKNQYGINTNAQTKEMMVSLMQQYVMEKPKRIRSDSLIAQLSAIERNSRGVIKSKSYTDLFMASCFCAYVRKLEYNNLSPLVEYTDEELMEELTDELRHVVDLSSVSLKDESASPFVSVQEDLERDQLFSSNNSNISSSSMTPDDIRLYLDLISM